MAELGLRRAVRTRESGGSNPPPLTRRCSSSSAERTSPKRGGGGSSPSAGATSFYMGLATGVVVAQRLQRSVVARAMSVRLRPITPARAAQWRVGRVWLMAAVSKTARAFQPSWVRIPGPPPNAAVAQRKSVRLLTGRPEVRLLPAVPHHTNALVTQAGRVRSLKPCDGGANPPGGTNSVVAQPGRGGRSRAC